MPTDKNFPYLDKPDPWSSHSIIANWLKERPAGTLVLDVGAGTGSVARFCEGSGLVFRGVEPNPSWAELAQPYYDEICSEPLQRVGEKFLRGFQVVVCADVLEHFPDPDRELARLVNLQAVGTLFFISLPNIANLWVRLKLLFGRFDYADRGILDRTHLRFFTQRTLVEMLLNTGLEIQQIVPTPIPLNLVHPFFTRAALGQTSHRALASMTRLFPTILGYQFVVQARKKTSGEEIPASNTGGRN